MRRHEFSDEDWRLVALLLQKQDRGGRGNDHRTTLRGMLWMLRTGAPWRDLPQHLSAAGRASTTASAAGAGTTPSRA